MTSDNTTTFTGSDMGGGSGNSKEVLYMNYILTTLTEARQSFKTGDTQTFNLYCQFLKNSILDKNKRDTIDKEMLSEEIKLKKAGYDEKYIEFGIGFIIVREIMGYINETLELSHDDIIGEVGRLDDDDDDDDDEEDIINIDDILKPLDKLNIKSTEAIHTNPSMVYQSYPKFSNGIKPIVGV